MIVKIGVSFSAREARELVAEVERIMEDQSALEENSPIQRLARKLQSPLTPDKIPAVVDNVQTP